MNNVNIKDYAIYIYIGITMLMKGLTVSPLKLQKIFTMNKHGTWLYLGIIINYSLVPLKHG